MWSCCILNVFSSNTSGQHSGNTVDWRSSVSNLYYINWHSWAQRGTARCRSITLVWNIATPGYGVGQHSTNPRHHVTRNCILVPGLFSAARIRLPLSYRAIAERLHVHLPPLNVTHLAAEKCWTWQKSGTTFLPRLLFLPKCSSPERNYNAFRKGTFNCP